MEKHLLREAFVGYLPKDVLWRQKEQSSDGVGYGWIDALRAYSDRAVDEAKLVAAGTRFPYQTPRSKEAYLYREIFEFLFDHPCSAGCAPGGKMAGNATQVASEWLGANASTDPSGRAIISIHKGALQGNAGSVANIPDDWRGPA